MSLQVWLPLNGNLNNQGLGEVTVTNNGATVDSNGKIGSCYLVNQNSPIFFSSDPWMSMKPQYNFSCFFWVKGTTSGWLFAHGAWEFRLRPDFIQVHVGPSGEYAAKYTSTFDTNTWYHLGFTWSGVEGKLRLYLNGNLVATSDVPSSVSYDASSSFKIPYDGPRYINDFRLYDHCLSAKEVKEISKGLICHYKLDNNGFGSPNLIEDSIFSANITSSYVYRDSSRLFNGKPSLRITRSGATSYTYTGWERTVTNVKAGDTIYASAWVYIEDPSSIDYGCEWRVYQTHNDGTANNWSGWYSSSLFKKDTWVRVGRSYTLDTNLSSAIFSMNVVKNGTYWIAEPKVEFGTKPTTWCPHTSDSLYASLGLDSTTEVDCSGLSNNGTKIGGLTPSTSPISIRYESCYDFDGNTGSIQIPNLSTLVPSGEFTMNCWIYHDDTWSSKGYETIFGGPSGFELEAKYGSTNSPALYAYSWGSGKAVYELNRWNMITMTRNASETKFYINGELKITGSAGTIPSGNYFIGAWRTSSEQNFKGKISDFRLYSTVLSVEDIEELYNTSASVDKNGSMYAYEFKEE